MFISLVSVQLALRSKIKLTKAQQRLAGSKVVRIASQTVRVMLNSVCVYTCLIELLEPLSNVGLFCLSTERSEI